MSSPRDVTEVLRQASGGNQDATDRLFPLVYDELNRLAHGLLVPERAGHTLQATALVHEAYLRLIGSETLDWKDRAHFFALAARAMRRVLIDHGRARRAEKRGADRVRVPMTSAEGLATPTTVTDLIALHEALETLSEEHPEAARIVEMRFFGGLTHEEISAVLDCSVRTVERHWRLGRAWLYDVLAQATRGDPAGWS